ncbi:PREDICTED: ceramide synthase 2 [Corvus brachyrhynchos]|uniref:ceramide synthase 2 n=1 Tax=Corvus brachyrhynchos TaxID=85066 RepID=UPI000816351E|nr:PREDICTED: ceramide synthase 2 [Corvus brachyrhynchos]
MFQTLYSYFWWERLWLPANLTWADLEDRDGRVYAKASDLYITLPLAFLFLIVRHLFETYVATPLAGLLNVKEKVRLKATPNAVLEKFYAATTKHPKQVRAGGGAPGGAWFSWRFTFYLIAFIAGMAVIVDKPWFYDLREVWKGYPIQSMLPSQYWYYMIELSFYWSLLFSIASDVKRKVGALGGGWETLGHRGRVFFTLVVGGRDRLGGSGDGGGMLVLPLTGVAFPGRIMHCTVFYPLDLYPAFFGYYFFNFMMVVLQSLHIFWAYLIIRMAQKFITGKVRGDLGPRGRHGGKDPLGVDGGWGFAAPEFPP